MTDYVSEPARPAGVVPDYPVPVNRLDNPVVLERVKDARGHNFVIRWPKQVAFTNGEQKKSIWVSVGSYGEEAALEAAWNYFSARYRGLLPRSGGPSVPELERYRGVLGPVEEHGKQYHGDRNHQFTCWPFGKPFDKRFSIVGWGATQDSVDGPELFCGHFELRNAEGGGKRRL
jgi:hypothetical protein